MRADWVNVYSTDKLYEADYIRENLQECGIEAVILNQQDSSYHFGSIYVQVHHTDETQAQEIIRSIHGD